jgi:hypothetical protein
MGMGPASQVGASGKVRLRVICLKPPLPEKYGAEFGLQDNSTTKDWVLHSGQRQANGDVHFECECRVRPDRRTNSPSFLGPFVHGSTAERFLYLSWRPKDWRPDVPEPRSLTYLRRMKVHLSGITWEQLERAQSTGGLLEATVQGRGRDGGPNCASVELFDGGWAVRKR